MVKMDCIFLKKKLKLCYVLDVFSNVLYYFCSILSAEFVRASLHDAAESDAIILSKAKARASIPMNGKDEVRLSLQLLLSLTRHFFCFFLFYMNLVPGIFQIFTIMF
jgi:hypothetical protein